jgi:YbbR domain-containing protein
MTRILLLQRREKLPGLKGGPVQMKNNIFGNLGLKIIALLLGFIVWLVVLNMDDYSTTKQITDIPVELLNTEAITEQNQLFDITSGETVDIIVKGRRSVVNELTAYDFAATADMSKLSITNAVPITVTTNKSSVANSISITIVDNVLQVELEEEDTVSLPVTVYTTGSVAEGYTLGVATTTPNLISVKGAASVVQRIDKAEVSVNVSNSTTDISTTGNILFYDKNGEVISEKKIEVDTTTATVNIPVYKTKDIAVNLATKGNPAEDYQVSDIEFVPETITVGAPDDVLETISEVSVDDIDVSGCSEDVETTVDITKYLPDGVVVAEDNNTVSVHVTIEKAVTKDISITADDIKITNKLEDYEYDIAFPDKTVVTISGLNKDISEVDAKDLNITIDAAKLVVGTNNVTLSIEDGEGYTIEAVCDVTVEVVQMP